MLKDKKFDAFALPWHRLLLSPEPKVMVDLLLEEEAVKSIT